MSLGAAADKDSSVDSGVGLLEGESESPTASLITPHVHVDASGERPVTNPSNTMPSATVTSPSITASIAQPNSNSLDVASIPRLRASTGLVDCFRSQTVVYQLTYFGNVVLDRRITQPMLPWIIDEKRRNGGLGHSLVLQISPKGALGISERKGSIIFEHRLHNISRFSRSHDKKCFGYLWRPDSNSNFRCFVFRATDDNEVHAIVTCIRDSDKENMPQSMQSGGVDGTEALDSLKETNSTMFEVMYCGRISVSHKRAPPTFIDESIAKFKEHEMSIQRKRLDGRKRHFSSEDRARSASDGPQPVGCHSHSLDTLSEDGVSIASSETSSLQHLQNNNSNDSTRRNSDPKEMAPGVEFDVAQNLNETAKMTTGRQFGTLPRMDTYTQLLTSKESSHNRTMVFQIGKSMLTLISLDKKSFMLTKKFSEISFCSQGIKQPEYFGFICREKTVALNYMCYVFKCQNESVVDCIMNTLRQAFNAALHHSKLHVICETCPMHQLHKVCQEVEGQSDEVVWSVLLKQIAAQGELQHSSFISQMKNCRVSTQQEQNHLAMMFLIKVCEHQQENHIHISDSNQQASDKQDTVKSESSRPANSKFESLKKAKKSLASSFENLLSRNKNRSSPDKNNMQNNGVEDGSNRGLSIMDFPNSSPRATPPPSRAHVSQHSPLTSPTSHSSTASTSASTSSTSSDEFQSPDVPEGKKSIPAKQVSVDSMSTSHSGTMPITRQRSRTLGDAPISPTRSSAGMTSPTSLSPGGRNSFQFEGDQFRALRLNPKQKPPLLRAMSVGGKANLYGSSALSPRTPNHRTSWRQAIFNRVVTPMSESKAPPAFPEQDEYVFEEVTQGEAKEPVATAIKPKRFTSRQSIKALWQRAIREQIILNRMEKENKNIQARQDAVYEKQIKMDYEEITPCLKEVTKQWDKLIALPNRMHTIIPYEDVNKLFKEGVPRTRREDIWTMLSEQRLLRLAPGASQIPESEPYPELLKQLTTHQHAILIDLGRTYPNHPYFTNPLGRGQLSLFNLLKAYSLLDDEVGYCQGLSFVAGILLMHMEEKDAFKMLEYLMFSLGFRRQYKPDMTALQIQMYQLSRLLHDFHHRLHDHLEQNDVAPSLYAAPWFLTLFASQYPLGFVAKVFDLIFLQGFEVIFKVALIIMGSHEELILQCDGFESIIDFIKHQLPSLGVVQMEKVINKAYHMDISKQLHAYEVEYHVIQEEMLPSPVQPRSMQRDIDQLETSNRNLRRHNNELLEQLQAAHNKIQHQQSMMQSKQEVENNLRSELRTLNLERAALMDTVAKLQNLVPDNILKNSGIDLVHLTSLTAKIDNGTVHHHQTIESTAMDSISIDDDSIEEMDNEASITKIGNLHQERFRNHSGGSFGSELSASTIASEADVPCIMINDTRPIST